MSVVLQAQTRRLLRQNVGFTSGAMQMQTASAAGSTTTIVDNTLSLGGTSDHVGKYIYFTSGANNANAIRRVTASTVAASVTTLTFAPAVTDATASGDTYELWSLKGEGLHPQRIHDFLNQGIIDATGLFFDPVESLALHADDKELRFDIPTTLVMINRLEYRSQVTSREIDGCESVWAEQSAPAGVTRSADT